MPSSMKRADRSSSSGMGLIVTERAHPVDSARRLSSFGTQLSTEGRRLMTREKTQLKVAGIDHVVLHVNDLARSRRFYVDLLGFEVEHEGGSNSFLRCGSQLV